MQCESLDATLCRSETARPDCKATIGGTPSRSSHFVCWRRPTYPSPARVDTGTAHRHSASFVFCVVVRFLQLIRVNLNPVKTEHLFGNTFSRLVCAHAERRHGRVEAF